MITIEWIGDTSYVDLLIEKVKKHYIQRESISTSLGLSGSPEYEHEIRENILSSLRKNFVLVAKHRDVIVACSINNDYYDDICNSESNTDISEENVTEQMRIFSAFCDKLEHPFIHKISPIKTQDIFYLNITYIEKNYSGLGILSTFIRKAADKACSLKYKYIMSLVTSETIQKALLNTFDYQLKNEMSLKDFEYEGKKPFALLKDPCHYVLAVKEVYNEHLLNDNYKIDTMEDNIVQVIGEL